jgi:beta-glucosidase
VRGLQGSDLAHPLSVLACAKHFIGDGGTAAGTGELNQGSIKNSAVNRLDQGDTKIDEAALRRIHLPGYISAINAGVGSIMPSYSSFNGVKCSASKRLLTEILKQELGFEGFLISDYSALDQIKPGDFKTSIEISINAGMDMVMAPWNYRDFISHMKDLVKEGKVPMSRIDDAVTRILRVKFALGLMDNKRSPMADRNLQKTFGSPEHRAVAREAVRKSLVLVKNDRKTLPLAKSLNRIHVAGIAADDIGMQCGGWTIKWQGETGNVTSGGTTILSAIKASVSKATRLTYSTDGKGADSASVAIAVIGEKPYAEVSGDADDLSLSKSDVEVIDNLKKSGIPVVLILLSGRPRIISSVLEKCDAFVAAFLPGTEGMGVTDVLFGDFSPTGKLSYSWPKSNEQLPLNSNGPKESYKPLFEFGYGLGYGK